MPLDSIDSLSENGAVNQTDTTGPMRAASRRAFLAGAAGAFAAAACDARAAAAGRATQAAPFYANLIHVSYHMWADRKPEGWGMLPKDQLSNVTYAPYLRCEDTAWNELLKASAEAGINLILMDLGDAIQYESHPEIAVKNAWSRDRLRDELSRMRKLGLEPIPKLNFSAAHDTWLGPYKRMVSTPTYYQVCRDLIREVIALYDAPRFFHLGYDEETAANQAGDDLVVVRQHELWWHDFNFFVDAVRSGGSRPWIWSDYAWKHGPDFVHAASPSRFCRATGITARRSVMTSAGPRRTSSWRRRASSRRRPARTGSTWRTSARRSISPPTTSIRRA